MNHAQRLLIWLLAGSAACAAIAWIAFHLQQDGIAPAVLFPILVGASLGASLVVIGRLLHLRLRWAAIAGAVCWGLLAAGAQDYIGHRYRLRSYDAELSRQNPLAAAVAREDGFRPTFADHLVGRFRTQPLWWTLDLVLTAAAAGIVTAFGGKGLAVQTERPARESRNNHP